MTLQTTSWYRLVTLPTLFFLLSGAACLPAFAAQPVNEKLSVTVKFGDLNLNTDAGRSELLNRLSKAAERICRDGPISGLPAYGYYRCYRRTLAAAVDKVHQEQVSALFAVLSRKNAY